MKKTIVVSSLALLLGIGSVVGYNYHLPSKLTESSALMTRGYASIDKLAKKSNTIVKATVLSSDFNEIEGKLDYEGEEMYEVSHVYKLQIDKAFKDVEGHKFKKGDIVELFVPIGEIQKKNGKTSELFQHHHDGFDLQTGEYLFYLTSFYAERYGKQVLMITNYNHIYKKSGKGNYENIVSDNVPVINESDLVAE